MQRAAKAKATIPLTDPFTCLALGGGAGGRRVTSSNENQGWESERTAATPGYLNEVLDGLCIYVYSFDLFTCIWHHLCTSTTPRPRFHGKEEDEHVLVENNAPCWDAVCD